MRLVFVHQELEKELIFRDKGVRCQEEQNIPFPSFFVEVIFPVFLLEVFVLEELAGELLEMLAFCAKVPIKFQRLTHFLLLVNTFLSLLT